MRAAIFAFAAAAFMVAATVLANAAAISWTFDDVTYFPIAAR